MNKHVNEPAGDDADTLVDTVDQLETRKKKMVDKTEGKKDDEPTAKAPRKRPSNSSFLDYVVVSDTMSGLDAGDKCAERDPVDDATLKEIMKKKKVLEDKKKELDEQAAATLAAKKSKLKKKTHPAPSESEIDLGVFSAKQGNLLEKIYAASGSQGSKFIIYVSCSLPFFLPFDYHVCLVAGVKSSKGTQKVDISQITPPTSPPSRAFDLSPPHQVGEGGVAGATGGDGRGGGVDTEAESSEATPRHTIYTKRVRGFGEGGASGTRHSPEYEHVQAERLFQKGRHRIDLLDEDIHVGVNFFATSQEIAREWQLIGEDTLEFEAAKNALAEEREKFNFENKGLSWRVADAEEKLSKEKQFNANKLEYIQCIAKLEKTKKSEEAEQERVTHQKREQEYIQCIAKLEKLAAEKVAETKAAEILAEEVTADCKWLPARAVPLISERIAKSDELAKYMFELGQAAYNSGRKDDYGEGRVAVTNNEKDYHFELYKQDCTAAYTAKRQEYEFIEFGIIKAVKKLSRKANAIEVLKKALGDQGTDGGDAGPSHRD
ncbi:hypothetical protein Hdeb2414_s0010g00341021 [Helianthus debilis subsp. tardiflorus]